MPSIWTSGGAGGGGVTAGPWLALANLGVGVTILGSPFLSTCDCRMNGDVLEFRGNLACASNGATFRMFDLPVGVSPPSAIRRILTQSGATGQVGLNFKPDGTVELAGTSGTFVILDGCSIPGWT
jgi:hypothetical protein